MAKKRENGQGSIFYRKDRQRWIYVYNVHGKQCSVSAKTQRELLRKKDEIDKRILNSEYIFNDDTSLLELLNYNLKIKSDLNLISDNSYGRIKETIKILEPISSKPIQKLTENDVLKFYKNLTIKYSDSTISKVVIQLKNAFNLAIKKNILYKSIVDNLKKPKSAKAKKIVEGLTINEQRKLQEVIHNSRYYLIYLIALNTGMRCGEILALNKKDIDFKNNLINIDKTITIDLDNKATIGSTTKTKNGIRKVPIISDKLKKELKEYLNNCNYDLLFSKEGKPIRVTVITSDLKRLNTKYNISHNMHTHKLRHTFATRCIESGMPAVVLAKLLGHSDVSITLNTYTSVFDEFQNKSLENMNIYLNRLFKTDSNIDSNQR